MPTVELEERLSGDALKTSRFCVMLVDVTSNYTRLTENAVNMIYCPNWHASNV